MKLPEHQYFILDYFRNIDTKDGKNSIELMKLAEELKTDPIFISASAQTLQEQGYVNIKEETYTAYKIGKEGIEILSNGLPERKIAALLAEKNKPMPIKDVADALGKDTKYIGSNLKFLSTRGWIKNESGNLSVTEKGIKEKDRQDIELLLKEIRDNEKTEAELAASGLDLNNLMELAKGRKDIINAKERTKRYISINSGGKKIIAKGIEIQRVGTQLTNAMLLDGSWKDVEFKKYDINIDTQKKVPGKSHPFVRLLNETRNVFLHMGFTEIVSPMVESSFWDFDALFQPQDHPTREMQDTFYIKKPGRAKLPEKSLVEEVRATHENGGKTGSTGWKYKWNIGMAEKNVLRTHTTAATVRAVASEKKGPKKVFIVGRTFRRETIDYKHLPVFYQVDGIIIDKNASFANLLGTLEAFYRKMGFEKFEFRPAFFPYTEPSVEVFVWHNEKKDWFEMGGAGVFRPEVTIPLGCADTVLAWGLGLERLAMFRYDLQDIRQVYGTDIQWLEKIQTNYKEF